ncbi:lipoprotein [Spiroplasma endosymbiont of Megaselia nigra]|uniref:lipoprotein n=1 Tax=Spiroplasma endosymbiont of Megaselia nigra TaxID=2478537 RepID=UPI000F863A69|nr:lipoprotein [Spiroplasma endosymbiont of Megaselia nigra]RUO86552.1 hypothetical protein D9R21_02400 [Spiroplasma endosymbiont of Megaselia nigra]
MKNILTILGTITLIGTSTTSLVACNNKPKIHEYTKEQLTKLKAENKINTKDGILEWISPQEKPFNTVDDKYYFVVWRGDENDAWKIIKFQNNAEQREEQILENYKNFRLILHNQKVLYIIEINKRGIPWNIESLNYFKSVYRWNYDTNVPNLGVNNKTGELIVN